jgi:DNA-binding Lrp family transcriptional regulator
MNSRTARTAGITAGAVFVALGAYAIGSQSGDGTAGAADRAYGQTARSASSPAAGRRFRGAREDGLANLAKTLGVTQAKLQAALKDLQADAGPKGDRPDPTAALAKQLKLDAAKVRAAFDKVLGSGARRGHGAGPGRHGLDDATVTALAKELGVTSAELKAAFVKTRDAALAQRLDDLAAKLAGPLGKDKADVAAALKKLKPSGQGDRRGRGGKSDVAAALAKELGVSTDKVKSAFDQLRKAPEAEQQQRRDDFAAKLAAKLGIDADKVKQALAKGGPGRSGAPGRGRGRRSGFDHPA